MLTHWHLYQADMLKRRKSITASQTLTVTCRSNMADHSGQHYTPTFLWEITNIYKITQKDRRQKGTHKNSASGLMIAEFCCVVRHHNAVAISTWKWKLNKRKAVGWHDDSSKSISKQLPGPIMSAWSKGHPLLLSRGLSLSWSLIFSLSHTHIAHCFSSDIERLALQTDAQVKEVSKKCFPPKISILAGPWCTSPDYSTIWSQTPKTTLYLELTSV